MAEGSANGQESNSHAERIRDEVNKLLPDINFDDDEEDDENSGPVEIFSRGKYISDLELCDFEEEEEEQEEVEQQAEELPSLPPPSFSFLHALNLGNGLSNTAPPQDTDNREASGNDDSLVSLMQRALRQLGGQETNQTSPASTEPPMERRRDEGVTSRGSAKPAEARRVLFGGLSATEHEQARTKYLGDRKVTLKFGQRGDIDLDELLRSVPVPDVDVSHYYDVEIEEETDDSKNLALIQKLEEMSQKYAAVSNRGPQPWRNTSARSSSTRNSTASGTAVQSSASSILKKAASSESSAEPSRSAAAPKRVEFCGSTSDPPATIINFVPSRPQSHSIGTGTETRNMGCSTSSIAAFLEPPGNQQSTVLLDLRPAPPPPLEDEGPPRPPLIYGESSESSEEEESSENDDGGGGGLWLDRHRRARAREALGVIRREAWTEEGERKGKEGGEEGKNRSAYPVVREAAKPMPEATTEIPAPAPIAAPESSTAPKTQISTATTTAATAESELDGAVVPSVTSEASQQPVSERVRQKIAEIKQKEEELRNRRQIGQRLAEQLLKDMVGEQTPLIFHEEESFSPAIPLLPEEALPVVTLRFEQRAPGELVTLGKRTRPIDDGRGVSGSHAALLSWLLSLAATNSSPFRLLGLQQSTPLRSARLETHIALHLSGPHALQQLQRFLATSCLADLCPWATKEEKAALSSQKLSAFLALTDDFEWRRSDAHFAWCLLRNDERLAGWDEGPAAVPELQTSVVRLDAEIFPQPARLFRLFSRAQRSGLDLAGCRLLHPDGGSTNLAVAFRGPRAVSVLCGLCGPGPGAELSGSPPGSWQVARFPEAVPRLLARLFGARMPAGGGSRHCLAAVEASDLLLLASPAIPEASWLFRAALEAGMAAVGVRRLRVDRGKAQTVLGMSEAQAAVFGGGCCHLLVLRRENAMGHAAAFVESAFEQLRAGQRQTDGMPPSSLLLYVMPCLPALLACLGGANLAQLPPISAQPISGEPAGKSRPIINEEEPCAFVLCHGWDCRRLMLEVLDQTTGAELLAIKLLPRLPTAHVGLLEEVAGQRLSSASVVCCALLRGLRLQEVLLPAMRHSNGKILSAKCSGDSIRLANAFFHDTEVIGDSRRRQLQSYLPESFLQNEVSTLASLGRELPEMLVPFTVTWESNSDRLWVVRRLWKWLESESFRISSCSLDSTSSASFLVLRSNALFRLDNGLRSYLSSLLPSANLRLPPDASQLPPIDIPPPLPKVAQFGKLSQDTAASSSSSWPPEVDLQETALLIISVGALQVGGRGKSCLHLLLELLSAKKLQLLACQFVELESEAAAEVEKFGDHQASSAAAPSAEGPVLLLLVFGSMARLGMRQLLRSKPNVAKMAAHVFVPQTQNETLRIAADVFSFVVPDAAIYSA